MREISRVPKEALSIQTLGHGPMCKAWFSSFGLGQVWAHGAGCLWKFFPSTLVFKNIFSFHPCMIVSNFLCYIFDHPFQLFWKRSFTPPPLIFRYIKYFLVSINILKYFWQVFRYVFFTKKSNNNYRNTYNKWSIRLSL
jgi:hypothetical protein